MRAHICKLTDLGRNKLPEQILTPRRPRVSASVALPTDALPKIFENLRAAGFSLLGPTVRDGAIVYEELTAASDLPVGWTDEQEGGSYRLKRRTDGAFFGYAVGPHTWKRFLHPPVERLWRAQREGSGFQVVPEAEETPKLAFIGVRSCELHAIYIQDKVLAHGSYADPAYTLRRQNIFVLAVNCAQAGGTCFCASMNTGPKATFGFDLALTEVLEGERHFFLVEVGTEKGAEVLAGIADEEAGTEEKATAERVVSKTAAQMRRSMDTHGIRELLYRNYEHPQWDAVAERCLACGNCTLACPTCFCTTVEDITDLTGTQAERWRKWDSCFSLEFTYIHGGSVRFSTKARYRQWMTHKLATWMDQFGTSGCVGCGRCITWCPVGIDITEEVRAIRESEAGDLATSAKENSGGNA